jgi:hypothetical protein
MSGFLPRGFMFQKSTHKTRERTLESLCLGIKVFLQLFGHL